jgi:hypothetical protein
MDRDAVDVARRARSFQARHRIGVRAALHIKLGAGAQQQARAVTKSARAHSDVAMQCAPTLTQYAAKPRWFTRSA